MRKNPHVRIRGGLGSVTALVYPTPVRSDTDVQRRVRLGGLLSFYHREAA